MNVNQQLQKLNSTLNNLKYRLNPHDVKADVEFGTIRTGYDKQPNYDRVIRQPARTWVAVWFQMLSAGWGNQTVSIPDTGNVSRTIGLTNSFGMMVSGAGDNSFGIQVGTSNVAVAKGDYQAKTLIAHGVGAGQLSHAATTVGLESGPSNQNQLVITRALTNSSGSDITIKESTLVMATYSNSYRHMLERTVLVTPYVATNAVTHYARYTLRSNI